ncbi:MAG: S-layer homology domain-containing protein [Clostridiales bacterium]|nr:S-layer homology domain-containing protein [Clostridiales bacterium]
MKRIISVLLTAAMLVGLLPVLPVFAEEEPVLLEVQRLEDAEYDEALSYVMMGTVQSEVEERGGYILTVFREGNTSVESAVDLKTADVSAKYGVDYIIDDDRYVTETTETESTLLELSDNDELVQEGEESFEDLQAMVDSSADTEENADKPEATEDMLNITGDSDGVFGDDTVLSEQKELSDPQQETEEGKSSLAQLKEEQTGLATRPTYETDMEPVTSVIMNSMGVVDVAEHIETSSTTQLVFAPGETEKQIIIRILEDNEAEGQEIINFMLSNPDENTELSEPTTASVVINDDEPVVHSKVSFKSGEFEAQDGTVTVTVSRTEALYSYVTAMVRTVENGDAKEGVNYSPTDTEIQFRPYQEETSFEIPVCADKDMSFGLELYDLKGGEDGELMTAGVNIAKSDNDSAMLELASSPQMIEINGKTYYIDYSQNSTIGIIKDYTTNPPIEIGEYWVPTWDNGFSYGGHPDALKVAAYDSDEKCGHLHSSTYFYNWTLSGYQTRTYSQHVTGTRQYQSFWLDCQTWSSTNAKYRMYSSDRYYGWTGTEDRSSVKSIEFTGTTERGAHGPARCLGPDDKLGVWDTQLMNIDAQRIADGSAQPEIKFWGLAKIYRSYEITLEQPDEMEFRTETGTIKKAPAKVSLSNDTNSNKARRYYNQAITVSEKAVNNGERINGYLKGFDITVGGGETFFYPTNNSTLTFNQEFGKILDDHLGSVKETDMGFDTRITIKPVYDYINVQMEILPSDDGKFTNPDLWRSSDNIFHVGDVISMDGVSEKEDYEWDSYYVEEYVNPGDTDPCAEDIRFKSKLELKNVKYRVRANFSKYRNFIEIQMDEDAKKYFKVLNAVPAYELKDANMIGKTVLDIRENRIEGTDGTMPVPGKAYTVELTQKEEGKGYRPKITQVFTGEYTDGYAMDFIAQDKHEKNIIKITAVPDVAESEYTSFVISGVANYRSVPLRESSDLPLNIPAEGASVTAGTSLHYLYDSKENKKYVPERISTESDPDGKFNALVPRAAKGDRVSVLITGNGIDQVQYITLTPDENAEKKRIKYTGLKINEETKNNDFVTEEKDFCQLISTLPTDVSMPIRTSYAPYIESINWTYVNGHDEADTRNNDIPIYIDSTGAMLRFIVNVCENDKKVSRVELIRRDKDGSKKQTYNAEKDADGFYSVTADPNAISEGDKLYARIICEENVSVRDEDDNIIETTAEVSYATVNTGLSFYIYYSTVPAQRISVKTDKLGDLPVVGDMAADLDSGKLIWKTDYADPKNPGISDRTETVMVSVSVSDTKDNLEKLDKIANGATVKAQKSVEDQLKDYDPLKEASEQDIKQLADSIDENLSDEEKLKIVKDWSEADKQKKREELRSKQKADSLAKMSEDVDMDMSFTVILRFDYVYDEEKNQHIFSGGQYLFGGAFNFKNTWYWLVYGIPVYVNVSGYVSVQLDGAYKTKEGEKILAKDIKDEENLLDTELKSTNPWVQLGAGVKIQPGVGICGIIGVRGIFKVDGVIRVLLDNDVKDPNKNGGAMLKMKGGVGVDLLIFSFEYSIGILDLKAGVYNKGKASLASADDTTEISVRNFDRGEERDTIFGKEQISLMSSLEPVSRTDIISGTMEYIRPEIVNLGDGRLMMIYLKNDTSRNDANAASLVYTIKDNGIWSEPVYINPNGTADSTPDIMRDGNKVYIAWSSADSPVSSDGSDISGVKADLQKMNIRMCVYDTETGNMSGVMTVTSDEYVNSDVKLTKEGKNIALYYLKKDISGAENAEQLVSTTANYSTWAKRVFDPNTKSFVKLISDGGTEVDEKLIYIKHPTVADPLVYDCMVEEFVYDGIAYGIASYSVDRDRNIETNNDREVWVQISDISNGKEYYPVKVSEDSENIMNVKLTKTKDDILLTWLSDISTFNTISIKEIFMGLSSETGDKEGKETGVTGLSLFRNLTEEEAADKNWIGILADKAKANLSDSDKESFSELFPTISDISEKGLVRNSKDFSKGSDQHVNMSDYQIVTGGDGNTYLFWTGASAEPENYGKELYGATFYRISDEWQEVWGESDMPLSGWGEPVRLTNYGEVIDEMTITVDEDKTAVIIANMYEQTIDENGKVCQGEHSLTEIDCIPSNSLEIEDDEITLSDEYPTPGEDCTIGITVKNNGLLPSEGQDVSIKVIQNGEVVFEDTNSETGNEEVIYPGNRFSYTTDIWTPQTLDGETEIVAEVREHGTDNVHIASRKLEKKAEIELGSSYTWDINKVFENYRKYNNNSHAEDIAAEIDSIKAIIDDDSTGAFDYIVFVPISNIGNMPMDNITANAVHVDRDLNMGDTLGASKPISIGEKEEKLIAIPVKVGAKHYTKEGVLEMKIVVNSGDTNLDFDRIHETVHESENVGVIANDGIGKKELKAGESFAITATAYPFDNLKNMYYFSSDSNVAAVSENGTVTAVGAGNATIYALDLSCQISDEIEVTVEGTEPTPTPKRNHGSGNSSYSTNAGEATATPAPASSQAPEPTSAPSGGNVDWFVDVPESAWYYESVKEIFEMGLMIGADDTHFEPETDVTRGMFATTLYRMENEPETALEYTFKDVPVNEYYAKPVAWASSNGIVTGFSEEEFAPDKTISREQMAAIMYRYVKYKGSDTSIGENTNILSYDDFDEISEYAIPAMQWSAGSGILQGRTDTTLNPLETTARAEAAAVFNRIIEYLK